MFCGNVVTIFVDANSFHCYDSIITKIIQKLTVGTVPRINLTDNAAHEVEAEVRNY